MYDTYIRGYVLMICSPAHEFEVGDSLWADCCCCVTSSRSPLHVYPMCCIPSQYTSRRTRQPLCSMAVLGLLLRVYDIREICKTTTHNNEQSLKYSLVIYDNGQYSPIAPASLSYVCLSGYMQRRFPRYWKACPFMLPTRYNIIPYDSSHTSLPC